MKGIERIKEIEKEYQEYVTALSQLNDKMLGFAVQQGNGYIMTDKRWQNLRRDIYRVERGFDEALYVMRHDRCCRQEIIEKGGQIK